MRRTRWYLLGNGLIGLWLLAAAIAAALQGIIPRGGWLTIHLLLLGAATTAILLWSQHFADALLRRSSAGGRPLLAARLLGHSLGAVLVVLGMLGRDWPLLLIGAVLVGAVAAAHIGLLAQQIARARPGRFGPLVWFYVAATLCLLLGVTVGVLLAHGGVPGGLRAQLTVGHVAANLLGWAGLTVLGTLLLLWPTVLHARASDRARLVARATLALALGGLLLLGAGAVLGLRWIFALGLLGYLAGALVIVADGAITAGRRKQWGFPASSLLASMAWLVTGTVWLGVLALIAPDWPALAAGLDALVPPLLFGFAVQVLLGATSQLLPIVLGGRQASLTGIRELERGADYRVAVLNLGILAALLPLPGHAGLAASLVVLAAVVATMAIAVRAVIVGRRARSARNAAPAATPMLPSLADTRSSAALRRLGELLAAAATVLLAIVIGAAAP